MSSMNELEEGVIATEGTAGTVEIESVQTKAKEAKTILHPMVLSLPAGSVIAILGPSGGGKTTLMNVITDNIESNIRAVGEVNLPGSKAFVPQDDRLHGFFTCKSYLQHYARLSGRSAGNLQEEIDDLLAKMGLTKQQDTIVGDLFFKGLSGGQKRRLSIALEALSNPNNLFLDEPTSGLDAESALQVMEFLKDYARAAPGRRVILTIHQPSNFIWSLIDHVVLLSKGRLMYQGPRAEMEDFFAQAECPTPVNHNPAEHYVTVVNDEFRLHALSVDEWASRFADYRPSKANSAVSKSMVKSAQKAVIDTNRATNSPLTAFELTYRYFLNLWFNAGILGTRVAMYSMLALMCGALFYNLGDRRDFESVQSRAALLFYMAAFMVFMSVSVLPMAVIEREIVDKEVRNRYYHPSYFQLSQGIASIPGSALLALVVTAIFIGLTGLQAPIMYFTTMFLSLVCAEALAQLVAHVVPHFVIGMAMVAGLYGFFMLFMGFMVVPSDFPSWLRWTHDVAFHTYAWRTFMYSEFHDLGPIDSPQFTDGMDVLVQYEIEDVDRFQDLMVLLGYAGVLHCCSFVVLWMRYNLFRGTIIAPSGSKKSA